MTNQLLLVPALGAMSAISFAPSTGLPAQASVTVGVSIKEPVDTLTDQAGRIAGAGAAVADISYTVDGDAVNSNSPDVGIIVNYVRFKYEFGDTCNGFEADCGVVGDYEIFEWQSISKSDNQPNSEGDYSFSISDTIGCEFEPNPGEGLKGCGYRVSALSYFVPSGDSEYDALKSRMINHFSNSDVADGNGQVVNETTGEVVLNSGDFTGDTVCDSGTGGYPDALANGSADPRTTKEILEDATSKGGEAQMRVFGAAWNFCAPKFDASGKKNTRIGRFSPPAPIDPPGGPGSYPWEPAPQ